MKKALVFVGIAAVALLSGCAGTTTTIIDPSVQKTNIRGTTTVSAEEFRNAANDAVNDALTNPIFQKFLKAYKTEMKNDNAIPTMKLTKVVNDTNDPDLKIGELTDLLSTAMLNSGIVDVTIAEGADLQKAIADSRAIINDPNFKKETVPPPGTLEAARIVLCPKVISSEVRDGRTVYVTRTFVVEMGDIMTGKLMWKFTKQLGFTKKRNVLGY